MKGFEFRLEPVLGYRKRQHDEAQGKLADAAGRLQEGKAKLEHIRSAKQNGKEAYRKSQRGNLSAPEVMMHLRYLAHLAKSEQAQTEEVARRQSHTDACRQALVKISKDKKVIEKLKDKQLRRFLQELGRAEQKQLDESGITRFISACGNER